MDLNRYKIFLSVADSGSFTAAAAAWNYTPSGVVHLINALEQEFGFPLFVRTRRGVHLTTDGEQLVAPLRDLVQCDDRLQQVCSKIQGVLTGKVRIGSYYSISAHWLPPVIGRFHRDFPGVQIELMEGHHQLLDGLMNQNRVDLCFYSRVLGGGREWIPLRTDPMVAIVPPEHRLASVGAFPIGAYRNEELVISARGNDSDVMHVFNKYRLTPCISYTTEEDHAAIAMVESGLGVSMLNRLSTGGIQTRAVILPLAPEESIELGIALPSRLQAPPAVRRFVEYAVSYIRDGTFPA